jgi:hypothetical protein
MPSKPSIVIADTWPTGPCPDIGHVHPRLKSDKSDEPRHFDVSDPDLLLIEPL